MHIEKFKRDFKRLNGVYATDKVVLLHKPLELYSLATGKTIATFKDLDEALAYKLDGKTLEQRIADWTEITFKRDGGRGSTSGMSTFSFGHASGGGGSGRGNGTLELPARMNVRLGVNHTPEDTLRAFREVHVNDGYESGVAVDEYGFVTRYVHGDATSVAITGRAGEMVYHNHPGKIGGNFSDSDLISTSMSAERGIVASGREGDYKFVKTHKFNASGFIKAVKSARMKGTDYNNAAHRWLKANQEKYGYTYSFTKAK